MIANAQGTIATKDANPERYCPVEGCLCRTGGGGYCPDHRHLYAKVQDRAAKDTPLDQYARARKDSKQ